MHVFGFFDIKEIECLKNFFDRDGSNSIDRAEFIKQIQYIRRIYSKHLKEKYPATKSI